MFRAYRALVLAAILAAAGYAAAGDLQITCPPGHRIYLDDVFAGLSTSAQDGLYLSDVPPGPHTVRIAKLGFIPVTRSVDVPESGPVEIQVLHLDATPDTRPEHAELAPTTPQPPLPETEGVEQARSAPVEGSPPAAGVPENPIAAPVREPREHAGPAPSAEEPSPPPAPAGDNAPMRAAEEAGAAVPAPAAVAPTGSRSASVQREPEHGAAAPEPTVTFAYRARGAALGAGGTVTLWRESGGPGDPAVVLRCSGEPDCLERPRPGFGPGDYRFRATCQSEGGQQPPAEALAELTTRPGDGYLIDVLFRGQGDGGCTIQVHALPPPRAGSAQNVRR